jgi:hypothetical protein
MIITQHTIRMHPTSPPSTTAVEDALEYDFCEKPITPIPTTMPASATIPASSLAVHRSELSLSLRCKIRALRSAALWPFRKIGKEFGVPLSTVYSICQQPFTPARPRMGRPLILTKPIRLQLIATATSSQANRRKPLMQIAEDIGITVNPRTLRKTFADAGYHRRVARVKPFLSPAAKIKRMNWADNLRGWEVADYQKIIWTDECAFNVGGFAGNTWVTRLPEEEYVEDCLVPKFRKLQTIMVWGCIYGKQQSFNSVTFTNYFQATLKDPWYFGIKKNGEIRSTVLDIVKISLDHTSTHFGSKNLKFWIMSTSCMMEHHRTVPNSPQMFWKS